MALFAGLLLVRPTPAAAAPFAYVAHPDLVSVIDTLTNAVTATVPVAGGVNGLAVSRDGTHVYALLVGRSGETALSIINTATNEVEATVTGVGGRQVALHPDGSRAYITDGAIPGYVSVFETATRSVINTIPVGDIPFGVAVSPDGSHVYVTNTYSDDERCPGFDCMLLTVSVIDTAQAREATRVIVGSRPHAIAVDPTGTRVYAFVGYPAGPTLQGSSLAVIDATLNRVLKWIPVAGGSSVAVAPSGDYVYTAGGYELGVVATNCDMTIARLRLQGSADAVAVTPDGLRLYTANLFDNTVSVIDTATNTVIDTLAVGDSPAAVAIGPAVIGTSPSATIGTPPLPTPALSPVEGPTPLVGEPCGDPCTELQACRAPCGARIVPGYCTVDCRCVAVGTETPTPSPTLPEPSPTPTGSASPSLTTTPTVTYTPSCACTMTQTGTGTPSPSATHTSTQTPSVTPPPTSPTPTLSASPQPTPTVTAGESCGDTCTPFQQCRAFFSGVILTGGCNSDCRCIVEATMTATVSSTPTTTPTPSSTSTLRPSPTQTTNMREAGSGCTLAPGSRSGSIVGMLMVPLFAARLWRRRQR